MFDSTLAVAMVAVTLKTVTMTLKTGLAPRSSFRHTQTMEQAHTCIMRTVTDKSTSKAGDSRSRPCASFRYSTLSW
jgi:hypothetical protein